MGKIFVSRQTAMLLVVICVLAIVCAGLIAALISRGACDASKEKDGKGEQANQEAEEEGGTAAESKGEAEGEGTADADAEADGEGGGEGDNGQETQQGRSVASSSKKNRKNKEDDEEEEDDEDEDEDDDDDDDDDDEEEEEERKRKARRRKGGSSSTSTLSSDESNASKPRASTTTTAPTTSARTTPAPKPWDTFRLPEYVIPQRYLLTLHPNLTTERFSGEVAIEVTITEPTDHIVVHAYNLTIINCSLQETRSGSTVALSSTFSQRKHQFFVVITKKDVYPGNYTVRYTFNGTLVGSGIVGLYKSVYKNSINGKASAIATSKFEPTYARRAFPCFDEPHLKASFIVRIVHQQGQIALSNMPPLVVNEREKDGLLETKFQESVPMSTYLACFIVCDFENSTALTQDNKPFSVYVTPGNLKSATYAREIGGKLQDFFATYFDIPYPLLKQDLIAIPDFVSGAMEHWGLITFREVNLLYDPDESSSSNMQRVTNVVSHELSHQWFGNLVTMEWWDDLWLNEGFATYMSYVGMDHLEPSWNTDELLIVNEMLGVMDLDSSYSSHPIVQPVHHPDEINEIFDTISYNKGASVIRMLAFFMGNEEFQQGIRNYLKKYAFSNARTSDLWNELSQVSTQNLSIPTIMDTWTKQMGYPIIHVNKKNTEGNIFTARQERFLFLSSSPDNSDYKESPYRYLWEVPLSYSTPTSDTNIVWLHKEQIIEFEVDVNNTEELIKFNTNFTGYYLVNYDLDTWKGFASLLRNNHTVLSRQDRVNLLYDGFSLAGGSHVSYSVALDLTEYLSKEEDYVPWRTVIDVLIAMSSVLEGTDAYPDFREYVVDLVDPVVTKLGWNDTGDHLTRLLRVDILNIACHHGHGECLRGAQRRLNEWVKTNRALPPNLRSVAYAYGMQMTPGSKIWNHMWQAYLHAKSSQEKQKLLYGLAQTKEAWLIHSLLDAAKNENYIRGQDYFSVLRYIAKNPIGRPIVWNFVRNEWEYLVKRFTLNDRYLGRLIPQLTSSFSTPFQQQEMVEFFRKYPEAGAGARAREQALERVKHNIAWLEHNKHAIKKWLNSHKKEKNSQ